MNKILSFIVLGILLIASPSFGMTFVWDPPTTGGDIQWYTLKWSRLESTNETDIVGLRRIIGATRFEFDLNLLEPDIPYFFHVTANNTTGESNPSNIVTYTRKIHQPQEEFDEGIFPVPNPIEILNIE